ncbi:MAG: PQQ-dependent sugar dehydrogenase [Gammaproteobacteria bacterium]|nr:PQQ-dependent sugar dehydrogenase [Gammaproteobacteria bacterium]
MAAAVAVNNPLPISIADGLARIRLPPGFVIDLYADRVPGARSMTLSAGGILYVGTRSAADDGVNGRVYAVSDADGDGRAEIIRSVAEGLNYPNGVAWYKGDLYIAEISRILRLRDIDNHLDRPPAPEIIGDPFPKESHHGWKFIRFSPEGKLYVPVGAPCNICEPDEQHGGIWHMDPGGSGREVFARGIRNSVGFDWHPVTHELWFTDNGRDLWGDDRPPEELNRAAKSGLHFGYPYRYGKSLPDPTFKTALTDREFTPAALEMPAHRAALGIRFYTGKQFPAEYHHQIFIAHHGSWNRAQPDGYRVSLARLTNNEVISYEDFATGWLERDHYWGRPVDIEILPDGSLLVSDDFAGVIYRIRFTGNRQ